MGALHLMSTGGVTTFLVSVIVAHTYKVIHATIQCTVNTSK